MTPANTFRPTQRQIATFRACFSGLTHVYGTYDLATGRAFQVKRPVTDHVIIDHLCGRRPYGVYLLTGDTTRAVVADFDHEDPEPPRAFVLQAAHYGITAYTERSKSKGWHVWIMLDSQGVSAAKARAVTRLILDDIAQPATEVFPKQDRLTDPSCFGNFIHAPLFGAILPAGRTAFVNIHAGMRPYQDQWAVLKKVRRVSERQLDEILAVNPASAAMHTIPHREGRRDADVTSRSLGLLPCVQRMLNEGVEENQRVACFRLAIALRKAGVPQDIAVACLRAWALKNRPAEGRRIITNEEIAEQTACAYAKDYRGCGCEEAAVRPFCVPDCPLRTRSARNES